MSVPLPDEPLDALAEGLAKSFATAFFRDELNAAAWLRTLEDEVPPLAGRLVSRARIHWETRNQALPGQQRRLFDQPIYIKAWTVTTPTPEVAASSTESFDPNAAARTILKSLELHFGELNRLSALNEGCELSLTALQELVARRLTLGKPGAPVFWLLSGSWGANSHMPQLIRGFLQRVCDRWGSDPAETLLYYVALLLLGGLEPPATGVSRTMAAFLRGESTRLLKPVTSTAVHFIHACSQALALQVLEVNRKYTSTSPDQRLKLVKLYAPPERRGLLLTHAASRAFQGVSHAKTEALEAYKIWKAYAPGLPGLLTLDDIFSIDYSCSPA